MTDTPDANQYPVDSRTRACCKGIGAHTPDCPPALRFFDTKPINPTCTPWCERRQIPDHCGDPACWSAVDHCLPLTLEEGYPADALPEEAMQFDPPRIGANAYRRAPGCQEIVFLHVYRASDNDHLSLDNNLRLTIAEAEELIDNLREVIDEIARGQIAVMA